MLEDATSSTSESSTIDFMPRKKETKQVKAKKKAQRRTVERELLELIDGRPLDMELIGALAGDRTLTAEEQKRLAKLRRRRGTHFYSDILFAISHEYFAPEHAQGIWRGVLEHKKELARALERNVGISVAALDYLTNIRSLWDVTVLIRPRKIATVAEIALVDGLTGLVTHSTFVAKLQEEIRRAERYGDTFSCFLLDLDDFKDINDTHGHAKGDEVLEKTGAILRDTVRETDLAARYGGEEFAVLLPRTSLRESATLAERLRANIEKGFAADIPVTVSIGVASFPKHAEDASKIVKAADKALYYTKRSGKNGVTVYPKERRIRGETSR